MDLKALQKKVIEFRDERDWKQYHNLMVNQEKVLIGLIGKEKYEELISLRPKKSEPDIQIAHSEWLLQKSRHEIMDFYDNLKTDQRPFSTLKLAGLVMAVTTHMYNLLIKWAEVNETADIVNKISDFNLHNVILFCTAKYNFSRDDFIRMMELRNFRNMIAHNFDETMEVSFNQAIDIIVAGEHFVLALIKLIQKKLQNPQKQNPDKIELI